MSTRLLVSERRAFNEMPSRKQVLCGRQSHGSAPGQSLVDDAKVAVDQDLHSCPGHPGAFQAPEGESVAG